MADRQFTYKVNVDTASAKRAADATRAMFAQSISEKGVANARTMANSEIAERQRVLRAHVAYRRTEVREANKAHAVEMRNMRTEANEMNRVFNQRQRQVALQQRQGAMGMVRGIMTGDVGAILGGGVVGFAAMQAGRILKDTAQQIVQLGTEGAGIARITRGFTELSEAIGINADTLQSKLRVAVQGTVSDYELMSHANLLLVTAQQGGIKVTEDQIAALARFARLRSTQLTLEGKNLTASEAFSRLIRGISKRESELLDELGISSKQLAAVTGKSVKEISGDVQSMLDAVLQVADVDFVKFGDPVVDAAGRIEAATAQATNQVNELRMALAEPVAFVVEITQGVKGGAAEFLADQINMINMAIRGVTQETVGDVIGKALSQIDPGIIRRLSLGFEETDAGQRTQALQDVQTRLQKTPMALLPTGATAVDFEKALQKQMTILTDMAQVFVDLTDAQGQFNTDAKGQAVSSAWENILTRWESGHLSLEGLIILYEQFMTLASSVNIAGGTDTIFGRQNQDIIEANERFVALSHAIDSIIGKMQETAAIQPLAVLLEDLDLVRAAEDAGIEGATVLKEAMLVSLAAISSAGVVTDIQRGKIEELTAAISSLYSASFGIDIAPRITIAKQNTSWQDASALMIEGGEALVKNAAEVNRLNIANARKAASAWEAAAKETERAFKDALGKIPGIPGVTGKSEVTQEQLDQAAAGIPQNFVDNFTRRMNDELVNGIDYPEVSRGFVEQLVIASAGIAPDIVAGLSNEMLASIATGEISTGRVFGTPFGQENFDVLVNMEVAKQIQAQNIQAEAGGAFVTEKFRQAGIGLGGVSAAGAAAATVDTGAASIVTGLDTDLKTQVKDNIDTQNLAQTIGSGISDAFNPGSEGYVDVAGPILTAWNTQFGADDMIKGVKALGKMVALNFFTGFKDSIAESGFATAIITAIKVDISKALADMAVAQ